MNEFKNVKHRYIIPIPIEYYMNKKDKYVKQIREVFKEEAKKNPKESFRILPPVKDDD